MKRMNFNLVLLTLLLSFVTSTGFAQTLKIATIAPEGSSWMNDMKRGAEVIDTQTQGRVNVPGIERGQQDLDHGVDLSRTQGQNILHLCESDRP